LSSYRSFSNISADFAARIKINDNFKIRMNRADEICHNISIFEVRKFRNHQYLTKFTFLLAHALDHNRSEPVWASKGGIIYAPEENNKEG
jgi:hypothetical protein